MQHVKSAKNCRPFLFFRFLFLILTFVNFVPILPCRLVYTSFWLGALGWEVLLTIPFEIRLLVETNWKSLLSVIHSVSYFLSRYATLSFIAYFIYMASPAQDNCQSEYKVSGSLFTVSVCTSECNIRKRERR